MSEPADFATHGFARLDLTLAHEALGALEPLFGALGTARAGHRLLPSAIARLDAIRQISAAITEYIGPLPRPVRALLFDKRAGGNWALGWHQDRTIEVRERIDTEGYGPWTVKSGRPHVAPPIAVLASMVTARIHLDAVDAENGPLLVAPGSHRFGLVPEPDLAAVVERCGTTMCLAERGDVWLYATPILHASDAASVPRHRRVLQVDFAASALPNGLEWGALE